MRRGIESVDLGPCIEDPRSRQSELAAERIRTSLEETGAVIVHDPRLQAGLDEMFRGMMTRYFQQDTAVKKRDEVPNHQVGWTPSFTEEPEDASAWIATLDANDRPLLATDARDPKERFFIPVADRPARTRFQDCYPLPIWPQVAPDLPRIAHQWSIGMKAAISTAMQMLAASYGLDKHTFDLGMLCAPHLLGPTGTNYVEFGQSSRVVVGVHRDLNLITGHGRASYPGLFIWTTTGRQLEVRIPENHLLLQAGKQLEILTAGQIRAGWHQVVVPRYVHDLVQLQIAAGQKPWRVTTTLFAHWALDKLLGPLPAFSHSAVHQHPTVLAGDYLRSQLIERRLQ